jgi:hypothetical protein
MRLNNDTIIGWEGWKSATPQWAAIASNYLMLSTLGLFVLSGFVDDWSTFIPEASQDLIYAIIDSMEKSFVTVGTALRFLGVKNNDNATNS